METLIGIMQSIAWQPYLFEDCIKTLQTGVCSLVAGLLAALWTILCYCCC